MSKETRRTHAGVYPTPDENISKYDRRMVLFIHPFIQVIEILEKKILSFINTSTELRFKNKSIKIQFFLTIISRMFKNRTKRLSFFNYQQH